MNDVKAQQTRFKAYGIVRNAAGEPQFDDYDNIPEVFHSALNEADWEFIDYKRKTKWQSHTQ